MLKIKDQVLEVVKDFYTKVEYEIGQKLKSVQADNCGEFLGAFESFCKLYEIKLGKTPLKPPQLNGLAERMNRNIEERVSCMLSHAKLLRSIWGEVMKTTITIINLSPPGP